MKVLNNLKTGCVVCGADLVYSGRGRELHCALCGKAGAADVSCAEGHFVCDECHRGSALDIIERRCVDSDARDPLALAVSLMRSPTVHKHGPEHHFLVPAVLLTVWCNVRGRPDKAELLREARRRADGVKGGVCGSCGVCGAAVGTGIFVSLVTGATPLSVREWQLSNRMTARALGEIAESGGPRCCKRDCYIAIVAAARFAREELGADLGATEPIECEFFAGDRTCLRRACPFYPKRVGDSTPAPSAG